MVNPDSRDDGAAKRLIASARRILANIGGPDFLGALCVDLFGRTPPEDLTVYSGGELAAFAQSAAALLTERVPGRHLIRIENPVVEGRGKRHRDITVVMTLTDNMPFLLDSLIGEIEASGCEIRLVAHPVVSVVRDRDGRLIEYRGVGLPAESSNVVRESLIQIHVSRLAGEGQRQTLMAHLDSLLVEVRRAVEAWPALRARAHDAIAAYRANPPPIDPDELAEAEAFLEWLLDDNFTFLGAREYDVGGSGKTGELRRRDTPGLGILSDPRVHVLSRGGEPVSITPTLREFLLRPEALIITKANAKSRVHRRAYMDYVGIKLFSAAGKLAGELRIVGLFTSTAYSRSTDAIPILRRKVARVLERGGHDPQGHTGKTLVNVLESYPRDDLFQIDDDRLFAFAHDILALEERPRVRALVRPDKFDRFVSVIVFVPRDRYDSAVRQRIGAYLAEAFDGHVSAYYPAFPEAMPLTRVHFIIGRSSGKTPSPARTELEARISALVRTWTDDLRYLLASDAAAHSLADRYNEAFPAAYRDDFTPATATADIALVEALTTAAPLHVAFRVAMADGAVGLKLMHLGSPIALSERVPILENMGFRVIDERSYELTPAGQTAVYLHDMLIEPADRSVGDITVRLNALAACFTAVWDANADDDGFNALVLVAGLDWRQAALLRSVARYLQQAATPFAQDFLWRTLRNHADISAALFALFTARFDPAHPDDAAAEAARSQIENGLESVARLDEDRAVRQFLNVIAAMVRTNFYQSANGQPPAEISFKLDSQKIEGLPQPRPFREIFVHSPRLEGAHLRFGPIARGGIRWSDRGRDFRTEILGLAKAQQVKNAVIVPVGAKGGFVARKLPQEGREQIHEAGVAAYRAFMARLLDLTDDIEGEKVVPPPQLVRHDDDDPYLVVAADKGTGSFSDIANAISDEHGFWLSDAFASGGSSGYDHKAMGITARGAWEGIKRHFRELDVDIQTTPFTVAGVGDMSGDVFGNGMLQSKAIRLVAAFDHRDIFIDPDPDPKASFAERERLFALPQSSWQDYDRAKISSGGGVFARTDKAIRLSREMRALLGISGDRTTPADVIRSILKAKVDLLYFGGIGTFIKGAAESDESVSDRANDAVRVTAPEVQARVIGEGANLAVTQRARVEYGLAAGRCNTDAIDNSAGVNTSDLEVNIKIAFRHALAEGRIKRRERDRLLKAMTDDVAHLVLANNYRQTLAISLSELRGLEDTGFQRRLMRALETRGRLNRGLEGLPEDSAVSERQKTGKPLARAEIAVLLAYAKIVLTEDLIASTILDDATLEPELTTYFPERMRKAYRTDIAGHRLRREIIATQLSNAMINRGGPTYLTRVGDQTGADAPAVAGAFVAVRAIFALDALNDAIDALDGKIPGKTQLQLYAAAQDLLLTQSVWFLRNADFSTGIGAVIDRFAAPVTAIETVVPTLPARLAEDVARRAEALRGAGLDQKLAARLAQLPIIAQAPDILIAADASGRSLPDAAKVYLAVAEDLMIARLAAVARGLQVSDYYDELALNRTIAALGTAQRRIAIAALKDGAGGSALDGWIERRKPIVDKVVEEVGALVDGGTPSVSAIGVAAGLISDLAERG